MKIPSKLGIRLRPEEEAFYIIVNPYPLPEEDDEENSKIVKKNIESKLGRKIKILDYGDHSVYRSKSNSAGYGKYIPRTNEFAIIIQLI